MEPHKVLEEWYEDAKSVVFRPSEFFKDVEVDIKKALSFTALSGILSGLLLSFVALLLNISDPSITAASFMGGLIFIPVFVAIFVSFDVVIRSALTHIVVYILGGKDYEKTLNAFAYPSVLNLIAWIPLVNLLVGIYRIYLEARGVSELHSFSFGKALVAVLAVPVILMLLIVSVIFATV